LTGETALTLPHAAELLLDNPDALGAWETELARFGESVSKCSQTVLLLVSVFTCIALIFAAIATTTNRSTNLAIAATLLALAALTQAAWRLTPFNPKLFSLFGMTIQLPPRIIALQGRLVSGSIEFSGSTDPSLFGGRFWPLLFSRIQSHRRHVRPPDGRNEPGLISLNRLQFDAWRKKQGWLTAGAKQKTKTETSLNQTKKSFWILDMGYTQTTLDLRLNQLIPSDSPKPKEMTREAMSSALFGSHLCYSAQVQR
jgi:hypothetical protein